MKKGIIFIFILLLFSIFWDINTPNPFSKIPPEDIQPYITPIRSIDPLDTTYTDLLFLKEVLKDKRIIMLGESLHYDGLTFLAKSRLVKFLHEHLHYNVLLFETGLYDSWFMNEHPIENNHLDPSLALFYFWFKPNEMTELWKYINEQRNGANPIEVGGFDLQLSGDISDTLRGNTLDEYLARKNILFSDFKTVYSIRYELRNQSMDFYHFKLDLPKKDSIVKDLQEISALLCNKATTLEDTIYIRYLDGMARWYTCVWNNKLGTPERFQLRDSMMADQLIWLVDRYPSDTKFIVWAANLHIINQSCKNTDECFNSMGEIIQNKYKDHCYALAFSSYARCKDHLMMKKGSNKGLEYFLHHDSNTYAFIDFRAIDSLSPLKQEFTLKVNQGASYKAYWSQMIDGLFFIDCMKNISYPED